MEYVLEESEIDGKCLVVFHFVSMDTILMEGGERSYVYCLVVKNNLNFKKIIINCIEKLGQRLEVESFQACFNKNMRIHI